MCVVLVVSALAYAIVFGEVAAQLQALDQVPILTMNVCTLPSLLVSYCACRF